MKRSSLNRIVLIGCLVIASAVIGAFTGLAAVYLPDLPQVKDLERYRPITDTVLYDDEGQAFASFTLQRRAIARYEDYPTVLYDAVLSIEDKDFEKHSGFHVWRMFSAACRDVASGSNAQGASTLTMQLARNLFLSPERTYSRKIQEILLAIQIERRFTKSQIFTLYANQIYLGNGVYGFASGAEFYFSKPVKDLFLDEAALLAALPKAPNNYSPIRNPERALRRRNLVIDAMFADGRISAMEAREAKSKPIHLHAQNNVHSVAPYFAEEIRQYLEKKYGTSRVHESGLRVYTTLNLPLQKAANTAVLDGLAAYERRRGWHGGLRNIRSVGGGGGSVIAWLPTNPAVEPGVYVHALVTSVSPVGAWLTFDGHTACLTQAQVSWTRVLLTKLLSVGDIVYVRVLSLGPSGTAKVRLEQESAVQGSLVAIDNVTGQIKAMVGGRDFELSKFNRATQALRQVGSSFKPYVYTAAVDRGAMPQDLISDAPFTIMTASGQYTPHNYDGRFEGNITLAQALAESRNIPALRLADSVGIQTVIQYTKKFGINRKIPAYLPVALGAVELTLLEHTSAFTVFPADGVRTTPRYLLRVTDYDGNVLEENYPTVHDVISERTARLMTSMLRQVVLHGTAVAANRLKFEVAGKTGTTNDFTDAWFVGFSPSITCGVWIGFDDRKPMGNKETGAMAALPIWIDFMAAAVNKYGMKSEFAPPSDDGEPRLWANHRLQAR